MKALVLAGGMAQIELLRQLRARGIRTVLADGSEQALARPWADEFFCVPLFDADAVRELAVREQVDFLITCCADQVLLVVAQVSEQLGLPCYLSYHTACLVSDKTQMKRVFRAHGIPTSDYVELSDYDAGAVSALRFPVVVKPADAYSSRGVRRAQDTEALRTCFEEAKQISRSGAVIVEEFCPGEEISVDVWVQGGKARILCISNSEKIRDDDRFVIFRGRYPANVSERITAQIADAAQRIADAFGLTNAPMLIQLISDGERISVLEFCARTGGNMKYLLIRHVCGADVISGVIDLTLGIKPELALRPPENRYIVNDFIYCRPGVFDHLEGFDVLMAEGIITDYRQLRPKGFCVRGSTSSSDRIAGVTIQADSPEDFNRKHRRFVERARVMDDTGEDIMRHELLPPPEWQCV